MPHPLIDRYHNDFARALQHGKSTNEQSVRNYFWQLLLPSMRRAVILFFVAFSIGICRGQTYQIGAMFAGGAMVPIRGSLEVTDSQVILIRAYADRADTSQYQFIRRTNNLVYFTDGVVTHFITISRRNGNQLGFDYDTHIVMNGNGEDRRAHLFISYYARQVVP